MVFPRNSDPARGTMRDCVWYCAVRQFAQDGQTDRILTNNIPGTRLWEGGRSASSVHHPRLGIY